MTAAADPEGNPAMVHHLVWLIDFDSPPTKK